MKGVEWDWCILNEDQSIVSTVLRTVPSLDVKARSRSKNSSCSSRILHFDFKLFTTNRFPGIVLDIIVKITLTHLISECK